MGLSDKAGAVVNTASVANQTAEWKSDPRQMSREGWEESWQSKDSKIFICLRDDHIWSNAF